MLHSDVIALLQINCWQRCREQGITARCANEEGAPGWTSGSKMGRASQLQIIELLECGPVRVHQQNPGTVKRRNTSASQAIEVTMRARRPSHEHKQKSGLTAAEEERQKIITLSSAPAIDLIGGTIVERVAAASLCLRHARQGLSGLGAGVERAFRETALGFEQHQHAVGDANHPRATRDNNLARSPLPHEISSPSSPSSAVSPPRPFALNPTPYADGRKINTTQRASQLSRPPLTARCCRDRPRIRGRSPTTATP